MQDFKGPKFIGQPVRKMAVSVTRSCILPEVPAKDVERVAQSCHSMHVPPDRHLSLHIDSPIEKLSIGDEIAGLHYVGGWWSVTVRLVG